MTTIPSQTRRYSRPIELVIVALLLALAGGVLVVAAERLPLLDSGVFGYDWHLFWSTVRTGVPDYSQLDVFNPPWTQLMLVPFGLLSFKASWALWTLITLSVFVLAVPQRDGGQAWPLALVLGMGSFWTLRALADGALEAFVVAGALVMVWAWRTRRPFWLGVGVLLATAKYQESWLLVLGAGVLCLRDWRPAQWARALTLVVGVAVPTLAWLGPAWFARLTHGAQGVGFSPNIARLGSNISLTALGGIAGWPAAATWVITILVLIATAATLWARSRALGTRTLGLLLSASMLVAPYVGLLSLASLVLLVLLPLMRRRRWVGLALIAWANLPYLTAFRPGTTGQFEWPELAHLGLLAATWLMLTFELWREPEAA
ncbi:MAG TPA: glycosyltransferase family 87 protein [Anaerolineales bacterium]|nr:glycosyltransferase family 87 protein [Anaerolineales bacterium]